MRHFILLNIQKMGDVAKFHSIRGGVFDWLPLKIINEFTKLFYENTGPW
jgi:hypothetical protein